MSEAAVRPLATRRVLRAGDAELDALARILVDCVEGGASVSFMAPLSLERAEAFWRDMIAQAAAGERVLLVAEDEQGICGTVQLVLALPENQPHRADVSKLLVHRRARRRGAGEALMRAAEAAAREHGRTVLVLDTGTEEARRLYERLGWVRVGDIPGYALTPGGAMCTTTYYFRDLGEPRAGAPGSPRRSPAAIAPLAPADRAEWEVLARGYKAFYRTPVSDAEYQRTWERLLARDGVFGLGARVGDRLVGISHHLFHTSVWAAKVCYLQDLYVAEDARGLGVARTLIEAVAAEARQAGAARYYWLTQHHNTVARVLYDKVARHHGFIRYDHPLS